MSNVTMNEIKNIKAEFKDLKPAKVKLDNNRKLYCKEAITALYPALNGMRKRGFTTEEILEKLREKGIVIKAATYRRYMGECRKQQSQKNKAKTAKPVDEHSAMAKPVEPAKVPEPDMQRNMRMPNYHAPAEPERKSWYQKLK